MRLLLQKSFLLFTLALLFPAVVHSAAEPEYPIAIFDHLCSEVGDSARYTSKKLKALKFLTEGKNGWVYRSSNDFIEDFAAPTSYAWLQELTAYLASRGTRLLMVYLPTKALMTPASIPPEHFHYNRALDSYLDMVETLRSLGIIVPDMASLIQTSGDTDFYFKRDIHWTPDGSRATARLVASAIEKLSIPLPEAGQHIVNKYMGAYSIQGFLQKGIQIICGGTYIPQYVRWFGTDDSPGEDGGLEAGALFQETKEAEVVLLGTSFSHIKQLNFSGYLQEYLATPVDNFSQPAGQVIGSWLKYIASGEFATHPPQLIIWELPSHYLLDDPMLFAQVVPTLRGGCSGRTPLVQAETILTDHPEPGDDLFFTDKLFSVPLSELVMDLEFSDKEINDIKIKVWYTNGKVKKESIKKPARADTGGTFVFSLFGRMLQPTGSVMAVELSRIEGMPVADYLREKGTSRLKVRTTVCRMAPLRPNSTIK